MLKRSEVTYKVLLVPINMQGHYKKINLDVFKIATYDVILELF